MRRLDLCKIAIAVLISITQARGTIFTQNIAKDIIIEIHHTTNNITKSAQGYSLIDLLFGVSPFNNITVFPDLSSTKTVLFDEQLKNMTCVVDSTPESYSTSEICLIPDKSKLENCPILGEESELASGTPAKSIMVFFNHTYMFTRLDNGDHTYNKSLMLDFCKRTASKVEHNNVVGLAPDSDFANYVRGIYLTKDNYFSFSFSMKEKNTVPMVILMPDNGIDDFLVFSKSLDFGSEWRFGARSLEDSYGVINIDNPKICFSSRTDFMFSVKDSAKKRSLIFTNICGKTTCSQLTANETRDLEVELTLSIVDDAANYVTFRASSNMFIYNNNETKLLDMSIGDLDELIEKKLASPDCEAVIGLDFHKYFELVFSTNGTEAKISYFMIFDGSNYEERLMLTAAMMFLMLLVLIFAVTKYTWKRQKVKHD